MLICGNCSLQYYLNAKPCAAVIIRNNKSQILLSRRAIQPRKGFWDITGGFLEEDETLEEGAHREIREELEISVDDLLYIGSYTHPYNYQGIDYFTLTAAFTTLVPGNIKFSPRDDVASVKWFDYKNLPYEQFAFPDQKSVFIKLAAMYNL